MFGWLLFLHFVFSTGLCFVESSRYHFVSFAMHLRVDVSCCENSRGVASVVSPYDVFITSNKFVYLCLMHALAPASCRQLLPHLQRQTWHTRRRLKVENVSWCDTSWWMPSPSHFKNRNKLVGWCFDFNDVPYKKQEFYTEVVIFLWFCVGLFLRVWLNMLIVFIVFVCCFLL